MARYERHDERIITDFERPRENSYVNYSSPDKLYMIIQIAREVGITNDILDVASDRNVHFKGVIPEREKREAFIKKMNKRLPVEKSWGVVALWKW